jgi:hypothetical protein
MMCFLCSVTAPPPSQRSAASRWLSTRVSFGPDAKIALASAPTSMSSSDVHADAFTGDLAPEVPHTDPRAALDCRR